MNKYVFIFHVDGPVDMTDELMEGHKAWFASLGDKLIDGGNPFNPDSEALVTADKVEHQPDSVAGYCIVSAENLDEAIGFAKTFPLLTVSGTSVKVYETMAM